MASVLLIPIFAANQLVIADTDVTSFDAWRPWMTDCGCHSGATNIVTLGNVEFDSPLIVMPGESFSVQLRVTGFSDAADGAITLGLHIDDFDNSEFIPQTLAEPNHGVDVSGDSSSWTAAFPMTAPETPGTYVLLSYGVDGLGSADDWVYVQGSFVITVADGAQADLNTFAESAADYLIASAVEDSGGLKWPEYNGTAAKYKTNYLKGAAGIGEFFLDMYNSYKSDPFFEGVKPEAEMYLDTAKGAATWLIARAVAENGGYFWPRDFNADNSIAGSSDNYTGMYAGAAGVGTFFLDMYRTTGDSTYLPYAEGAATWILSMANKSHGYKWVEKIGADNSTELSTRWTFGSPGIGGFFIDLFLTTDNALYAESANKTIEGLIEYADSSEGGYHWNKVNGNTEKYVGRWHGAAGVGTFFLEMYELYENTTHLGYARGIAEWIFGTHEEDQGYYYPDNNNTATKSYKLGGWSRSAAGIASFYLGLHEATSDANYLGNATAIADFLINNATLTDYGLTWADTDTNPRIATAIGHGLAGTGLFFIELYQATGDELYQAVVQGVSQALGDAAVATPDGFAWTQSDLTSDVHMGLYYGVAGVGKFMLDASHMGISINDLLDGSLEYLMSTAVVDGSGLKWSEFNGTAAKYKTNYLKGAAGIGELFLQAYDTLRGDPFFDGVKASAYDYLDTAKGAAAWLVARAVSENGGYFWPRDFNADNSIAGSSANYTGMYGGAAGIGTFFLDMYRTTGDTSYLAYAEGAATWLESMANKSHGYQWVEKQGADNSTELSTRWTFGSPGIGGFFVNLYLATGNNAYASAANKTVEGLIFTADSSEGGYHWNRYNTNTEKYVGRWHGDAGIGTFFLEMYDLYGNATYLGYAEGIADWIFGTHEEDQGYFYPDNNNTATKSYKLGGWSRSSAGIASYVGRLFSTTGNPAYLANSTQAVQFLLNNATVANNGIVWADTDTNPRIPTAIGHGLSGTGIFMTQAHRLNPMQTYREGILNIISALDNLSYVETDGLSWTQSDLTTDVHMGLYYGVAGVGLFLLEARSSYPAIDFDGPDISSPVDIAAEVDDVESITWTIEDMYPGTWSVSVNGTESLSSDNFDSGDEVMTSVDTSEAGVFEYVLEVTDFFGRTSTDSVIVVVSEETTTTTTSTTTTTTDTTTDTTTPPPFTFDTLSLTVGLVGGMFIGLVLGVLVGRRR
jgi:rhamnogalacturonyl hydrolase YesR